MSPLQWAKDNMIGNSSRFSITSGCDVESSMPIPKCPHQHSVCTVPLVRLPRPASFGPLWGWDAPGLWCAMLFVQANYLWVDFFSTIFAGAMHTPGMLFPFQISHKARFSGVYSSFPLNLALCKRPGRLTPPPQYITHPA